MSKILIIFLFSSFSFTVFSQSRVIYGKDGRVDTYESQDPLFAKLSESTVALFRKKNLIKIDGESYKMKGVTYQKRKRLCDSERFKDQPAYGFCSGFLVGPDIVITAGHCISSCDSIAFVFDFKMKNAKEFEEIIPKSNVYTCEKILSIAEVGSRDHALIKLDRTVTNRVPLRLRKEGEVQKGDRLIVIGHPGGIPTKLADGAAVRNSNPGKDYFTANLDTYGGNSGSAVFNLDNALIEGILVRGAPDYVKVPGKSCFVSNVCEDDGCDGEEVTKISVVPDFDRINRYQKYYRSKSKKIRNLDRKIYGLIKKKRPYYRKKQYYVKGIKIK